jgi:hypothetical protein
MMKKGKGCALGGLAAALLLLTALLTTAGCGSDAANSGAQTHSNSAVASTISHSSSTTIQKHTLTTRLMGRSTSSTIPEPGPANPQAVKAGTPHAWALAASAVLTRLNGDQDDLLGGKQATPLYVSALKQSLDQWWGIKNREDLLDMLSWADEGGGHRADWDELVNYLNSLDEAGRAELMAQAENDAEMKHQVEMAVKYGPQLGKKSLIGWDYARYISLCRWGYACGYLSEQEAWDRIMPVAALLQRTFSSWADLGENYLIGREFWSLRQTQESGAAVRAAYDSLLSSPTSPWKENAWDMDLEVLPSGDSRT